MDERLEKAREIVKKHMWMATTAGIFPVPVLDITFITAVQLKMIRKLAGHYEIPFSGERTRAAIISLGTSLGTGAVSKGFMVSVLKAVPVAGSLTMPFIMPTMAGAATYALGTVFIQHFESGGNFLNFDPDKVRSHFRKQFDKSYNNIDNKPHCFTRDNISNYVGHCKLTNEA
ncbi:MAG: YcjF family protein [Desulfamplus sp.]|nr:YcjF family protein [Desulfamplus sp.]